jgi:nitrile hydratase accessory protein
MTDAALIPLDPDDGPGYEEPWQAQAFACAIQLSRTGVFSRSEWTHAFSQEIRRHPERLGESPVGAYYRQVLDTLERLIREKSAISSAAIAQRIDAWRQAYFNTPHGHAVELQNARCTREPEHAHHPEATCEPVAMSPPRK